MGRSGKERHLVAGLFLNLSVYLVGDTQGQGRHSACSLSVQGHITWNWLKAGES